MAKTVCGVVTSFQYGIDSWDWRRVLFPLQYNIYILRRWFCLCSCGVVSLLQYEIGSCDCCRVISSLKYGIYILCRWFCKCGLASSLHYVICRLWYNLIIAVWYRFHASLFFTSVFAVRFRHCGMVYIFCVVSSVFVVLLHHCRMAYTVGSGACVFSTFFSSNSSSLGSMYWIPSSPVNY